jgi:regulator of cell morphogenesis and NO signaling
LFRRHKLDFCCGGRVPLTQAAAERGLPLDELGAELNAVAALGLPAERPESTDELIGMIETRYHAVHRRELPEMVRLARRVEVAHKDHSALPGGVAALLERMNGELEEHMQKEEQALSPQICRGARIPTKPPGYTELIPRTVPI